MVSDWPFWLQRPLAWHQTPASVPIQPETAAPKPKREPAVWRPMTAIERRAAIALGKCRLPPASSTKRMCYQMADQARLSEPRITDKQAAFLWQFAWTFRRQIDDADVREIAKQRRNEACNGPAVLAR